MTGFPGQFDAFERNLEVALAILRRWKADRDYFPTIRELQEEMGLSSPSRAHDLVKKLVERGQVKLRLTGRIVWVAPAELGEEVRNAQVA